MREQVSDKEVGVLLHRLLERHGYDFTGYARASMYRRLIRIMDRDNLTDIHELAERLDGDKAYLQYFIEQITVNVTEMFRDPSFYNALIKEVIPVISTYPLIRIWHAGCATGEEVYSMAILLHEASLLHKSLLYATDINPLVLEKAMKGFFPMSQMKQYSANYIRSGGKNEFSSYYTAGYGYAMFSRMLSERMVFSTHNLVSDSSFNQFQLILCRNVLIYFEKPLQDKVLKLFDDSLEPLGFLALGNRENIRFSPIARNYTCVRREERIWRKQR